VNPFAALGLPATAALTDAEVRAAWRDAATATHPDRADGGDPAAYAAAATAYEQLRTAWSRSEALADLAAQQPPDIASARASPVVGRLAAGWRAATQLPARVRHGRPGRLAIRTITAVVVAVAGAVVTSGTSSAPAIVAGCALWWALTARGDLAPPPGR
jgi:hypothetical protein